MTEQWCDCQVKCVEDTEDTWTCTAHLAEGRAMECHFAPSDIDPFGKIAGCGNYQPVQAEEKAT